MTPLSPTVALAIAEILERAAAAIRAVVRTSTEEKP